MNDEKAQASALYRPGTSAQAEALLPWVTSATEALDIPLEDFDAFATARHLAGLLEQARIVTVQPTSITDPPALQFLP